MQLLELGDQEELRWSQAAIDFAALVRTDAPPPSAWLIFYEDHVVTPEVFVGEGAKEAAYKRFNQARDHWSCHLFARVADSTASTKASEL
jgi:hypothetical protein